MTEDPAATGRGPRPDAVGRMGGRRGRGGPPPWWPADEPWAGRRRAGPGFGCLFGIVFVAGVLGIASLAATVVGGIVAAPGVPGHAIRLAALVVAALVVVAVIRTGATIRRTASVLDELVDQVGRVERGDYAARVETSARMPRPARALVRGFNTMAERLAADEQQRRRLLADVTHELRTPLTVIAGNVEAILDGVHPADAQHLGTILDETRILGRLVEDLRTLTLSEAGSLSLHREPTDLDVLAGEVAASFETAAATAGVAVETAVEPNVPLLDVDPVRIREVLGNLVANALRHTPAGGRITIRARPLPGGSRPATVEIVVADTGHGIDPALLPHVFERFARGAGSTGSGLGLSIARGLVELHGGSIEASVPRAGGAEVRIVLPVAAS